jgi:hypothetical protein
MYLAQYAELALLDAAVGGYDVVAVVASVTKSNIFGMEVAPLIT